MSSVYYYDVNGAVVGGSDTGIPGWDTLPPGAVGLTFDTTLEDGNAQRFSVSRDTWIWIDNSSFYVALDSKCGELRDVGYEYVSTHASATIPVSMNADTLPELLAAYNSALRQDPEDERTFSVSEDEAYVITNAEFIELVQYGIDWLQNLRDAQPCVWPFIADQSLDTKALLFAKLQHFIDNPPLTRTYIGDAVEQVADDLDNLALAVGAALGDVDDTITAIQSTLSSHGTAIYNINDALPGKSNVGHTHAYSAITGTPTIPDDLDDLAETANTKHFSATEKAKLAGIAAGATANSSDATLLARANHTGTQAQSTVTNLTSDLAAKATVTALNANTAVDATQTADIEALQGLLTTLGATRIRAFTVTTNASGEFSQSLSGLGFTAPKGFANVLTTTTSESYVAVVGAMTTSVISGKVFRNKTQGVLLGGTIDPDELVGAGVSVCVVVFE